MSEYEITGLSPGPDIPAKDEARVATMVDELTLVQLAALEVLLSFKCHGTLHPTSAVASKLERVLTEAYGDDLQLMLTDLLARLR